MRKIEKQMIAVLQEGRNFELDNTRVEGNSVYLHNHHIADMADGKCVVNMDTLAAWPTRTTRSRLNALGAHVNVIKGITFVNGSKLCATH
jgi:hypothetical protein